MEKVTDPISDPITKFFNPPISDPIRYPIPDPISDLRSYYFNLKELKLSLQYWAYICQIWFFFTCTVLPPHLNFFLKGARWGFNCLYCIFSCWFQIYDQNLTFLFMFFLIVIYIFLQLYVFSPMCILIWQLRYLYHFSPLHIPICKLR